MLQTTLSFLGDAARTLKIAEDDLERFCQPDFQFEIPIELRSGQRFTAYRVLHRDILGPYKGGVRFHPTTGPEEVRALATLMSLKTACVGLPLGGGKGGVCCDPRQLSPGQIEELSRQYMRKLIEVESQAGGGKKIIDIPAPDVNTNAQIMDYMADEYSRVTGDKSYSGITGKSLHFGGSLGRDEATGRGGVVVLDSLLQLHRKTGKPLTIAIQGFGNVGSHFARIVQEEHPDWQIVAVSDYSSALKADQGSQLSLAELVPLAEARKPFRDYRSQYVKHFSKEELLGLEVDVLVLAAMEDAITSDNQADIKAKWILELANSALSHSAYSYLEQSGHLVIPGILANAGGVIVSYFEFCQNVHGSSWPLDKVHRHLHEVLQAAIRHVGQYASKYKTDLYQAAFIYGLKQLYRPRPVRYVLPLERSRPAFDLVRDFDQQAPGVDMAARPGEGVVAVTAGQVVAVESDEQQPEKGFSVTVHHRLGVVSHYGRLTDLQVRAGDFVKKGDPLGRVISQLPAYDSRLRFAIDRHYHPVDPKEFLKSLGARLTS